MRAADRPPSNPDVSNVNRLRVFISSKMNELRDVREIIEAALHSKGHPVSSRWKTSVHH
jgi:hypothetical protein